MRMNKKESEEIKRSWLCEYCKECLSLSASDLPVSTCGALSAQNEKRRAQNIVLV